MDPVGVGNVPSKGVKPSLNLKPIPKRLFLDHSDAPPENRRVSAKNGISVLEACGACPEPGLSPLELFSLKAVNPIPELSPEFR
jgi:hypothetical protein